MRDALHLERQHGDIVKLWRFAHEPVDVLLHISEKLLRAGCFLPVQSSQHLIGPIQRVRRVCGFGDTVRVDEQRVSGLQRHLILPVTGVLHAGQHKAMPIPEQLKFAVFMPHRRVFMPRVGRGQLSGRDFKNPEPHGDEHLGFVVFAQLVIDLFQHLLGREAGLGGIFQQGLGNHHEQGCRHPLPGYVGNHQGEVIIVHQEKVIKVAAHLLGRGHGRINFKLLPTGKSRENTGQHGGLDLGGHVQLRGNALLIRGDRRQVCHVVVQLIHHVPEGNRQGADFIPLGDGIRKPMQTRGKAFIVFMLLPGIQLRQVREPLHRSGDVPLHVPQKQDGDAVKQVDRNAQHQIDIVPDLQAVPLAADP